ncbi:Ribosomal protein L11 methyltransferase [hydrothermal vent metagenome]|uniref:Ribosomal protein L11 methyltransferase n=1 Tax=hydrothermal vent metagenome TaxID=652676 RepID=A0A3B0SIC9_9ZZZZ
MTGWKMELTLPDNLVPMVQEIIYGLDGTNFPTLSDFEIEKNSHSRLLEAYFSHRPDIAALRHRLQDILPAFDLSQAGIILSETEEKDWVSESQKLLQPVNSGLFFVYGCHDTDKIPPDRINILLEAGQAFGTGQHETTHGCLLAIGELAEEIELPETALDLGCGAGLLAIAMYRLWPTTIVASDIDPIATETTCDNVRTNGIPLVAVGTGKAGIAAITSDGFGSPDLQYDSPYDVIVANILAGPLQDMAADIVANLSGDGSLILSGLLDRQEKAVLDSYTKEGMGLVRRYVRGEWHSLMLRRK